MNRFDFSDDQFTRLPSAELAAICADARELVGLLHVDSYTQMGRAEARQDGQLAAVATRLERALGRPLTTSKDGPWTAADHPAAYAFAQAFRLSALYPDTVSADGDILATVAAPSFRCVHPAPVDADRHASTFRRLCERIGLSESDRAAIENEAQAAQEKLARRRRLLGLLRAELQPDTDRPLTSEDARRFFTFLFPDNPLLPGEVEVIATRSCVYFCILAGETFVRTVTFLARDAAAREQASAYLKRLRQFNFFNFSHFPAFTSFEARELDPAHLERLGQAMDMERAELVALLNTAVFVEERDSLEKYLVHDSWGHYWQADLTRLGTLYDRMASLALPLSPGDTLRLDDKLCSFLDLVYLRRDGTLDFDEALARRYAAAWTHERFQPLLAPIIAELAADMVEYVARRECAAAGLDLPSSSLFAHQPAKIDFAWADLLFFVKALKRVNAVYARDEELKAEFVERARLLFRLKYRRNYPAVASPEALEAQLGQILERLLAIFDEVQEAHLGTGLAAAPDPAGHPQINTFFQAFLNLLQIDATLNNIVHGQMEGERPHLALCFQTLVMFIVKYFERDPLGGFWTLSDTLGTSAVPLLEALAASAPSSQNQCSTES